MLMFIFYEEPDGYPRWKHVPFIRVAIPNRYDMARAEASSARSDVAAAKRPLQIKDNSILISAGLVTRGVSYLQLVFTSCLIPSFDFRRDMRISLFNLLTDGYARQTRTYAADGFITHVLNTRIVI